MKFHLSPIAAAVLAVYTLPSVAQQAEAPAPSAAAATQLKEVKVEADAAPNPYKAETVSSPKYTEALVNTPQTITVIKKEVLQERVATTLTEALRNTPGITLLQGENGNSTSGDAISMRGFDTQNAIFLDNIRDLGTAVRDTFNIEQIEVVKGPAGADNGRGATAGYVNLASKLPSAEDFRAGTVSYGTADRRRITADINEQIGSSTAVRLNVMGQDGGVAGRDFIERRGWGVAPSIAFGLNTPTRFYLFSQHIRQDNTPDGGVPTVGREGYRFSNSVVNPLQQTLDAAGRTVDAPSSKNYYGFAQDFENIEANMVTAKFEHDLKPGFVIRNIARYGKSEQQRVLTGVNAVTLSDSKLGTNGDGTTTQPTPPAEPLVLLNPEQYRVTRSVQGTGRTNEILTNQTNLTAEIQTGAIKHSLGGGLELIHEKQLTPSYAADPTIPPATLQANLYNPDRSAERSNFKKNGAFSNGQTTTTAVYVFDTAQIQDRWFVNGSLRWERYNAETDSVSIATATSNPPLPAGTQVPQRVEDADNLLSWKAGVLFKPTNASSVYVSHATSLKPPGDANFSLAAQNSANGSANANINNPALDPQEAKNTEIGTKWDLLDGRLAATAAIFKGTNKNDLARASDNPDIVIQYGKREVKGVELAAVGQITKAWNITAGVAKLDADIKQGTETSEGAGARFTPELTATLWTTYNLEAYKLQFGFGAQYVDSQTRSETNNPQGSVTATTGQVGYTNVYEVGSYTVFDAMVAYQATRNVTVQLNGYNLGDEKYFAAINNGGSRYIPGIAQSYLLSLNVRF